MSWRLIDPHETRGPDKAAARGCILVGSLLVVSALVLIVDVLRGCSDSRHGCAYVVLGAPVVTLIGIGCIAAGYWLYPRRPRNDHDGPPNVR